MTILRCSNKYEMLRDLALISAKAYSDESSVKILGFPKVDFIEDKKTCTQVYVASNANSIVCAFRGTKSYKDFFTDFKFWMADVYPFNKPYKSHAGFELAYESVRERLRTTLREHGRGSKNMYITGHSLGGALATIASLEFPNSICATFGSPKVFNRHMANDYHEFHHRAHYRVVKAGDFVTRIPSFFKAYRHVKKVQLIYLLNDGSVIENPSSPIMTTEYWRDLVNEIFQCNLFKTEDHAAFDGYYTDLVRICHIV